VGCNDDGGFAPCLRHPRPHSCHPPPSFASPPPLFASPRPCSCHPTLVRVIPPLFASSHPCSRLPALARRCRFRHCRSRCRACSPLIRLASPLFVHACACPCLCVPVPRHSCMLAPAVAVCVTYPAYLVAGLCTVSVLLKLQLIYSPSFLTFKSSSNRIKQLVV
jgi:hypothetical protein